jgi:hypothetical protein
MRLTRSSGSVGSSQGREAYTSVADTRPLCIRRRCRRVPCVDGASQHGTRVPAECDGRLTAWPPAVSPTRAQAAVKRVQHLCVYPSHLKSADLRTDVSIDVAQIRRQGRRLNVDDFEVPVHQLIDRGARSRVALLVHLAQEPRAYLLSPGFSLWPGRDDLGQVVPSLRHRVDARVHANSKRTTRQHVDAAAWSTWALGQDHGGRLHQARVTFDVTNCPTARISDLETRLTLLKWPCRVRLFSSWGGWDSNPRPRDYESPALTG